MITFSNAKINIGLNVIEKRRDGFHNISTVFYPIQWFDVIEITPQNQFELALYGDKIYSSSENNLVTRAYHLLLEAFPQKLRHCKLTLLKCLPSGGGIGGGSANASFTLKLLNDYFNLQLTTDELEAYALQLGSDCPFFIRNTPQLASGRGEVLTPVQLNLKEWSIMVVNPGIHVSTREAFEGIQPYNPPFDLAKIQELPVDLWQRYIVNDFEKTVFEKFPEIKNLKQTLLEHGAVYASLSGTGSTVYGLFPKDKCPVIVFPKHYRTFIEA